MPADGDCIIMPVGGYFIIIGALAALIYTLFIIEAGDQCCGCCAVGKSARYFKQLSNASTDGDARLHMERVRQTPLEVRWRMVCYYSDSESTYTSFEANETYKPYVRPLRLRN